MNRTIHLLFVLCMLPILLGVPPARAGELSDPPGHQNDDNTLHQDVPINIVLVGFAPEQIDHRALLDALPATSRPVVRSPRFFYGLPGRDLGLEFRLRYRLRHAGQAFENAFFEHLMATGEPGPLTRYQQQYNDQERNRLDVTGPVLYLDGPAVERWLMDQGRSRLGLNPKRSYTLYLINWYGRPDFRFHVYQNTAVSEPDTGLIFGARDEARSNAWGGSHGRTWFYDLSAGPEFATRNFIVDTPDLDGDGLEDERLPPAWEYAPGAYREPTQLTGDLARIARFVAINQLFVASPTFDPLASSPAPGGAKAPYVVTLRDNPGGPRPNVNREFVIAALRGFQPYYPWQIDGREIDPIDPGAERAFRIATGLREEDDCWNELGDPFAQLFCFFTANRDVYLPPASGDYLIGSFVFDTTVEQMGFLAGAAGTADDNWVDGTPSFVYTWTYDPLRSRGRGPSWTVLHEIGHHLGLPHPFDGYDPTLEIDYAPEDDAFLFAASGLHTDSVMSVLRTSNSFGQFDRDNLYRYEFAGYMQWSRLLSEAILASPEAHLVRRDLLQAGRSALRARRGFQRWEYLRAATEARASYETLQRAADRIGVHVDPPYAGSGAGARTTPPDRIERRIDWEE